MSKRLVLLFCALFVFAAAVPAFAAVQNVKVSGDIIARYVLRNDFDNLKGNGVTGEDQINAINTVTRLRVDADLTDNVSTVIRLINERNWEEATVATTDIDLDLAYVTMKEFLYSPLTLAIGRQELHFGNDMIIGDGVGDPDANAVSGGIGTNQTTNYAEAAGYGAVNGDLAYRKAFDAIRATFNYDPLVLDVVYARIDHSTVTGAGTNDMINLWGANAGYKFSDKWNTMAEGYLWSKVDSSRRHVGLDKTDTVITVGARVSTNPTAKLNLQQEIAWQGGKKLNNTAAAPALQRERNAWASQSIAMVTPGWKYNPTIGMIYSYFSGDANRDATANAPSLDKKYHAWDPMFENQTAGHIINALYPQSNTHNINARLTMSPFEDVVMQWDYVYLAMAKAGSQSGAANMNDYDGTGNLFAANKKSLGQEFDANLLYNYTEDVQFGLLTGWFWPGSAYDKNGTTVDQRVTATEMIASCSVKF
jgi:hypothetical protein